jgi:hypothetical protein
MQNTHAHSRMFAALEGLEADTLAATQRGFDRKCRQRAYAAEQRRAAEEAERKQVRKHFGRAIRQAERRAGAAQEQPPARSRPPPPTEARRERPAYDPSQTPCRYGPNCKAEWCHFGHPWRYRHAAEAQPKSTPSPKSAPATVPTPAPRAPVVCEPCEPCAPGEPAPPGNEDRLCVICFEHERTYALLPCGHRCVCATCFEQVLATKTPKCPLCNTVLQHAKGVRIWG